MCLMFGMTRESPSVSLQVLISLVCARVCIPCTVRQSSLHTETSTGTMLRPSTLLRLTLRASLLWQNEQDFAISCSREATTTVFSDGTVPYHLIMYDRRHDLLARFNMRFFVDM